ncbi:MAG: hypothetical protein J6M65_00865 [Eubacterium sp.]|nr:hypothetical protein [Eubacterium sp.]
MTLLFTILIILSIMKPVKSYAGNINSEEARVIGTASGTFTYKGKTYRAYSSYIDELYSYLAEDDIDLDSDDADAAIAYIYENVKEGIDEGYVYEVKSEDDKNNVDLDKIPDTSSDNTNEAAKETAAEASNKEVKKIFEDLDKEHEERLKYSDIQSATDSDASLIVDDKSITVTTDKGEIKLFSDSRIIPKSFTDIFVILGIVILVINIVIFVVLSVKSCMRFKGQDRSKPKKGHRKRRRIRKICRNILTVTSSIAFMIICLIIAISIVFFNNDKIMQTIQGSGYFRYGYTLYLKDTASTNDGDTNESSEETGEDEKDLSYEDFIVKEKLSISSTFESEEPLSKEQITDRSIAPYIKRMQIDLKISLIISFICCTIALAFAIICNVFMDLRRDRGVKSIAISVFVGTIITFVCAVLLAILRIEDYFFVEPGYLISFLNDMMDYLIKVFMVIGLFGTAIGASLVGLYKGMRKDR